MGNRSVLCFLIFVSQIIFGTTFRQNAESKNLEQGGLNVYLNMFFFVDGRFELSCFG